MGSLTFNKSTKLEWIWKDGVGGYQDLLDAYRHKSQRDIPCDHVINAFTASLSKSTLPCGQTIPPVLSGEQISIGKYYPEDIAFEVYLSTVVGNNERPPANTKYTNDEWYGEIYNFLLFARHTSTQDRLKQLSLQRKASEYRLIEGDLFRVMRGVMKRCVVRSEVAPVLEAAHDLEGHWKLRLTLKKLNNVFWPNITKDTADFIAGCLKCGKYGNAHRTHTALSIIVTDPVVNRRYIQYLGFLPFEIDGGYQLPSVVETIVRSARRTAKKRAMKHSSYLIALAKEREEQENAVFRFIAKRERCWDEVPNASSWAKQVFKDRHDTGIQKELNFTDGTMVMLFDGKSAKKQLHPSYRGPFIISEKGGSHGKSYTLKQINGTPIPGTFYGDHLKPFVPRTGHLITSNEEELSLHQNIRAKKGFHKLPQRLRVDQITVDGDEREFE
ncbi:hypothetical protein EPUL_002151 [Erysiphe pulchra]|uniref:Integrase zinc-binding domain-containing protein n=1 Tax=Erysiphe pulchra TaxID=225359 RepID=A0A2S4PWC1_9PEZI|nr:hypothetical protein EPUL_002151 [Erysiphe pulchra]